MNKKIKTNKGTISIFALLSMMFFLIFIMAAYNNVIQKSKTQVETRDVLQQYYKPKSSSSRIIELLNKGSINGLQLYNTIKEVNDLSIEVIDSNANKYICSNKGFYQITSPIYQEVQYIESNGTQYIDTMVPAGIDVGIKIKFMPMSNGTIFGAITSAGVGYYGINCPSAKKFELYWNNWEETSYGYSYGNIYEIRLNYLNDKSLYIGNEFVTALSTGATITSNTIHLFKLNFNLNPQYINARIYSLEITNGTNTIRNYIPCCRKSDEVAGLYDTVTNTFYTNAGSGTFGTGPNI